MVNASLMSGCFPSALKHAVVHPLIKKSNLDLNVLSNFRPISKLPFVSKVLEKVPYVQLQTYIDLNEIGEKFQSGFKLRHITEWALLKVFNYLFLTVDAGKSAVLLLLDLSAAFKTVDHSILLTRLETLVGIKGTALNWFRSYLSNRSFSVNLGQYFSCMSPLNSGVP